MTLHYPPDIRPLLQQTFGANVDVLNVKVVNQHVDYWVLIAELRQPTLTVVIKLAGEKAPLASEFDRTALLHQLVATQTRVPIAEVLAVSDFDSLRYLIKTHIPGEEWKTVYPQLDAAQKRDAYQQIGHAVRQIHNITFPAFGEIGTTGTPNFQEALRSRARLSIKNPRFRDLILSVIEHHGSLFHGIHNTCLCHEDLHHGNVLFSHTDGGWKLATILDFEKAWAGHAEIDLARLEFWDGMVGDGFWEGYGAIGDQLYAQRRLIYQLLWCLEYAVPTERHLRDTQRVCEALGMPAIKGFE